MSQTEYAVEVASSAEVSLIDCDVHNYPNSIDDLMPYLSARWQAYVQQSGFSGPPGPTYPKGFAQAARRDAWPPSGLRPGGDPDFARTQLLDAWGIDVAVLNPLYGMTSLHNLDFANALMCAVNEWTAHTWLDHDPRWRGSIVVNASDPAAAATEIKRARSGFALCAGVAVGAVECALWQAAVPAGFCRGLRGRLAGGHPLWRQRPADHGLRLAFLLHRRSHGHVASL